MISYEGQNNVFLHFHGYRDRLEINKSGGKEGLIWTVEEACSFFYRSWKDYSDKKIKPEILGEEININSGLIGITNYFLSNAPPVFLGRILDSKREELLYELILLSVKSNLGDSSMKNLREDLENILMFNLCNKNKKGAEIFTSLINILSH